MQSFAVDQSGAKLRYLEFAGRGRPLLMLHGLGCTASYEYPAVALSPALAGRYVVLIDLPGFGYSDAPPGFGYRTSDHAAALARLVGALGFAPLDLYGHSMGGSIAIELADQLGERVAHLVVSEANLDAGGGVFSQKIAAEDADSYCRGGHERLVRATRTAGNDDWAATLQRAAPEAVYFGAKSLVEGVEPDWRSRLLRHPARRRFIFGARNLPDPEVDALAAAGIEVLSVPEAGHSMGLENPAGLAEAIATATG